MRSTDLWKLTLTNITRNTIQISLAGTLEEARSGIIVNGTSKQFNLPPGAKRITYDDIKIGNVTTDPFYITYEWLNKNGNVICSGIIGSKDQL